MCIIIGPVDAVSNTEILVILNGQGQQFTAYGNTVTLPEDENDEKETKDTKERTKSRRGDGKHAHKTAGNGDVIG